MSGYSAKCRLWGLDVDSKNIWQQRMKERVRRDVWLAHCAAFLRFTTIRLQKTEVVSQPHSHTLAAGERTHGANIQMPLLQMKALPPLFTLKCENKSILTSSSQDVAFLLSFEPRSELVHRMRMSSSSAKRSCKLWKEDCFKINWHETRFHL